LYKHLLENRYIQAVPNFNRALVGIRRRDVLQKIKDGDASWEAMVPPPIVEVIKRDRLFGFAG
jgi:hypothetical protein